MGHIHAAAMAEYAKDATETDKPWERWEVSILESNAEFRDLHVNPEWALNRMYRRKVKTIIINGHKVPEPLRTPPEVNVFYWIPFGGAVRFRWKGDGADIAHLKNGFVHLTQEAAEKHFNAMKSFTAKFDYD